MPNSVTNSIRTTQTTGKEFDGSWANDPLDLRTIRLDAEIEEGWWHEEVWIPKTLNDCHDERFKDFTLCGSTKDSSRWKKPLIPTFILDANNNIVEHYCHDPYDARNRIIKDYDETHSILLAKTLEFISLKEAEAYE